MIRLFVNGLAASAGGGLTYLRNVIPHLAQRDDAHTTILLSPVLQRELTGTANVTFVELPESENVLRRWLREQTALPGLIRRSGANVLISAGNFALFRSPIPQILLSRNSLYTSPDFMRDIRNRRDYAIWADTLVKGWLARRSIRCADVTVAPSEAFARDLGQWSGREVEAIHHGFDAEAFTSDAAPLPLEVQTRLEEGRDALRLLFVSHYNYYRNFEALLRAMPILSHCLQKKVRLYLTCRLTPDANPGSYRTEAAATLVRDMRTRGDVVELGSVPYRSLHHLYRACDMYVTPAYAESFAHPLVEAMSSGLPVVASDLPVHREICGGAAVYFSRFSSEELAERICQVSESPDLARDLASAGLRRANDFSWKKHVSQLVERARNLVPAREKQAGAKQAGTKQ
jgi:glycosyltransferase involved in cell wall biosynthesis